MRAYVVTETRSDVRLLKELLKPEFDADRDGIHVTEAGGWSGADSLARSILIIKRVPVVLVVGALGGEPVERERFLNASLAEVGDPALFRVFVIPPSLDAVLFRDDVVAQQLIGRPLDTGLRTRAESEPRKILEESLPASLWQQRGTILMADPLTKFYDERLPHMDLSAARQTPEIQDLKAFLARMTGVASMNVPALASAH